MTDKTDWQDSGRAVPEGRAARLLHFGGLVGGIGGRVLAGGLRDLASGRRPSLPGLMLTPANAADLARHLARMRGAAMKAGQLLSMEAGDFLPPEMTAILSRLRAEADPMPPAQLRDVLDRHWGKGWISRFRRFDVRPIAAASIGQVHRAVTKDGRDLAIKVQYPGIRASIDSDIANLGALMRMSGMVPPSLNMAPLLADARAQLHEEADYAREVAQMTRFADLLADDPAFALPRPDAEFSGMEVLAMDYIEARPIETLAGADQTTRDHVVAALIHLTLRELFDFNLMQTDPNFANFRWQAETGRIVLLDFGATRSFGPGLAPALLALLEAGLADDRTALREAAIGVGYFSPATPPDHQAALTALIDMAMGPLRAGGLFDTAQNDLPRRILDRGAALSRDRSTAHLPPTEVLFLHRKLGGLYLLAARLGARVDLDSLLARVRQGASH
ncbi:MAG: ABC1 kinase family protein [Pseudorhodobacter sp.]